MKSNKGIEIGRKRNVLKGKKESDKGRNMYRKKGIERAR